MGNFFEGLEDRWTGRMAPPLQTDLGPRIGEKLEKVSKKNKVVKLVVLKKGRQMLASQKKGRQLFVAVKMAPRL
jgi:hypothetical protein